MLRYQVLVSVELLIEALRNVESAGNEASSCDMTELELPSVILCVVRYFVDEFASGELTKVEFAKE